LGNFPAFGVTGGAIAITQRNLNQRYLVRTGRKVKYLNYEGK
jgi:hypothetical protein